MQCYGLNVIQYENTNEISGPHIWKPDRQKQHSILSVFFSYLTEIATKRHSGLFNIPSIFMTYIWKNIDPRGISWKDLFYDKLDLL